MANLYSILFVQKDEDVWLEWRDDCLDETVDIATRESVLYTFDEFDQLQTTHRQH